MSQPSHIGDGVYVQHDESDRVIITTGRHYPTLEHPGSPPDNVVFLEDTVTVELLRWLGRNDPTSRFYFSTLCE